MSALQNIISSAADKLTEAFENFKATKKARKALEKRLQHTLEEDPDYLNLIEEEKKLKKSRRDISDRLSDIKHQKELMTRALDEYEELENFVEKTEGAYLTRKDEVLMGLEQELTTQGLQAELNFKNGTLMLIVSRGK